MIKISTAALQQIQESIDSGEMQSMPLRIAIKKQDDGSFHYAMGFDDQRLPGDNFVTVMGLNLVISEASQPLAEGMTLDFVALSEGQPEFIFLNPNDPTYVPPE